MQRVSPVHAGDVFGLLTVIEVLTGEEAGRPLEGACARVRCACGRRKTVRAKHLRSGSTRSCGCAQRRRRTCCRHGHELAPANVYTWRGERGTERQCRVCRSLRNDQRRALEALPDLFASTTRARVRTSAMMPRTPRAPRVESPP